MQLPLPLPRTLPMLPCSPGRFHHLLLCWLFYWNSWFYVLHWAENFISFLASIQIVFRVRLECIWFLNVWTRCKSAKEWGALSPSPQSPQSPSSWDKKLKSCSLVRRRTKKWFMSALPLLSAYYMSHLMHKDLGWAWTHQPRERQETWCISLDASGHI